MELGSVTLKINTQNTLEKFNNRAGKQDEGPGRDIKGGEKST
jgi:hypothetical protein